MAATDSTQRFSTRVDDYVRYRPTYPPEVLQILTQEASLRPDATVADLGSGTGISAKLFLSNDNSVFGVEPNREMRLAAEQQLAANPKFHSIDARAEATQLPDVSMDFVVAAQAFHWFDIPKTRREMVRILRPNGWVVLLWNTRRTKATAFLRDYEGLLQEYGTDYNAVQHENVTNAAIRDFYAGDFTKRVLSNEQRFDFEGVKGRLLSSSYAPGEGHPRYASMLQDLATMFRSHAQQDRVVFEYDTELYFGQLGLGLSSD